MTWRPGISWPFGERATFRNGGARGVVIVTGKRWPWSKPTEHRLRFLDDDLQHVIWTESGMPLQLAPDYAWRAILAAAEVPS